jgi:hypothetical protein
MLDAYKTRSFDDAQSLLVASVALLAGAIAFLGRDTLLRGFRVAIVLLLVGAVIAAFAARQGLWLPDTGIRRIWLARILVLSSALLALAVLVAAIGYTTSAWHLPQAPVDIARVTNTVVETTATPIVAPPAQATSGAGVTTTPGHPEAESAAAISTGPPWLLTVAGLCAMAAAAAFLSGKRTLGKILATASIAATGWKLFNIEKAIDKLSFHVNVTRPPAPPPAAPLASAPFDLLMHVRIGGFDNGDAVAPPNARANLAKAEEAAQTLGRVGLAIAVGHVDYRNLKPGIARRYGSNQGLALQRAIAIQQMLTMTVITTVGGPVRTQQPVAPSALADDRAVDVYFFGTRNPT